MSTRISPGVKAAGAYGWRPTTLVVPNVKKIRGFNLPGTPWATSAWALTYPEPLGPPRPVAGWPLQLIMKYLIRIYPYPSADVRKHRIQAVLSAFAKLRKATVSFVMSVCLSIRTSVRLEQLGSNWTNFHEIWYLNIFRQSVDEIMFLHNLTIMADTSGEDLRTFMISRGIIRRMRNILVRSCRENQHTHFMVKILFLKVVLFVR